MSEAVTEISTIVEQLNERVLQLESRVAFLEDESRKPTPARVPSATPSRPPMRREKPPETWQGFPSVELPAAISTLGKAVLGMAGAYLFRALAESGTVPKLPVIVLAIVYAALWMLHAVRVHANTFASITYALTSLLILSPMLWETTVRFEFLAPAFTGSILVGFFAITLALAWKRGLEAIPWLTVAATMGTALALLVATRHLLPLTISILAAAVLVEAASCFGHVLTARMLPALAASISVCLVISLMTSEPVPEGYAPVNPRMIVVLWSALLAIYTISIAIRGLWLRHKITIVDIVQGSLAFAVAAFGAAHASGRLVAPSLGLALLILAAGCYWAAFSKFAAPPDSRNRRVFSTWAAALLITGSMFLLPPIACVVFLCMAAAVAAVLYYRGGNLSMGLHSSTFLAAAFALSSLPRFVFDALTGTVPALPNPSVLVMTFAAALCYVTGSSVAETRIRRRALWLFPALITAMAAAALVVTAIAWSATGHWDVSPSRLPALRSIVNCALALTLGFLGLHWRRIELGWVAYAAVAFGTLKLIFEDLPSGSSSTLVFSFLFYGVVLIVLPRLTRRGQTDYLHPRKYFVFSS
jgi:hypothetical protein